MPSEAGYYTVSFTGGNVHVTDSDPPRAEDFPYLTSGSTRSGAGITGVCGTPPGLPGAGTVDCTGTLTATFTFVPEWANEEPPKYAVVYELSEASYVGDSGDCANGLGHPALPPIGYAKTSVGERWTLRANPGTSFPITVTPSASSVWVNGDCGETSGEASVSYTAGCYPVYVKLEGTLKVYSGSVPGQTSYAKHECMIGQQVVATLICPDWPDNTRSWAVEGGNAFADYQVAPPNGDSASLLLYSQGQTGQSTTAYFREPGAAKFQCTAFLGGPIQQQVTVKGEVTVKPPNFEHGVAIGEVKMVSDGSEERLALADGGPLPNFDNRLISETNGILWGARTSTPAPFWPQQGWGGFRFVQCYWPSRFWKIGAQGYCWSINGFWGLDESHPYRPGPFTDPPGFGEWASNWVDCVSADRPTTRLELPWTSVRTSTESYSTYFMYRPPHLAGFNSRWVCLMEVAWYWNGLCDRDGSTWYGPYNVAAAWSLAATYPTQPLWLLRHVTDNATIDPCP